MTEKNDDVGSGRQKKTGDPLHVLPYHTFLSSIYLQIVLYRPMLLDDSSSRSVTKKKRGPTAQDEGTSTSGDDNYDAKAPRKSRQLQRTRSRNNQYVRSPTRVLIPWLLSILLAISLFTTFTSMPPELPETLPHIAHNDVNRLAAPTALRPTKAVDAGTAAKVDQAAAVEEMNKAAAMNDNQQQGNHRAPTTRDDETITSSYGQIDLASLHLDASAASVDLKQVPANHPMQQNPIMNVLRKAMVSEISLDDWKALPDLAKNLVDLYGARIFAAATTSTTTHNSTNNNNDNTDDGPIVLGMETCEAYRKAVPFKERYVGPAGMFNTGTNALTHHLSKNLVNMGHVWQIPWGKHRMEWRRLNHFAPDMEGRDQTKCMPVVIGKCRCCLRPVVCRLEMNCVTLSLSLSSLMNRVVENTVRDPYSWMQSMCKSPYAAHWKHRGGRCPNLIADQKDHRMFGVAEASTVGVEVKFDKKNDVVFFDSLADLWSIWYGRYYNATYPHLIVRFEDMLLQAPAVLAKVAECVGTEVRDPILYQQGSAKNHGSHTDFLSAVLKTADKEKRAHALTHNDLEYAAASLDSNLMSAFQYNLIPS